MKLPDFPLAPWEVPLGSGIPLVAPADLMIRGGGNKQDTEYLIRAAEFENYEYIFFREVESTAVGNWLRTGLNTLNDLAQLAPQTYEYDYIGFKSDDAARVFCFDGTPYGNSFPYILVADSRGGTLESQGRRM